jgi:hypothetical protein
MNAVIIGSSGGYLYASNIGDVQAKDKEIQQAYENCIYLMYEYEKEHMVIEITVIYNGELHEFLPEKQLTDFLKTI